MLFNETNYFEESKGIFKAVANINANEEFKFYKRGKGWLLHDTETLERKVAAIIGLTDEKEIKKVKFNFMSRLDWETNRITSMYFVYKNNLIRISDHWSYHLNNKNNIAFKYRGCGGIRTCLWDLKHKVNGKKWEDFEHRYFVGMIKFSELRKND